MLLILRISMYADLQILVTCLAMDRLLESRCYTQIFGLQGKQNISVAYVDGGWVRVWERGSFRGNE